MASALETASSQEATGSPDHAPATTYAIAAAQRAARLPGYRDAWRAAGFDAGAIDAGNWSALPPLTKHQLIEAASEAPPFGGRLAVPASELAQVFVAPGPIYMPYGEADMEHVAASFARAFRGCGLEAANIVDQTTMYNWVIAATAIDRALRMIGCCVIPGGVGQTERHLEVIRAIGVDAIVAFPTFLEHILALSEDQGSPLPLKKAVVMGELSHPVSKRRIRETYGIEVREFYGTADVGAVAWECSAHSGMHLREDILVEFLSPDGNTPVEPSPDSPAELVVTDFHREAMPIIRLRTGDVIEDLDRRPCACGRNTPRFSRIVGRANEITKVKGMFVVPRQVEDTLRKLGHEAPFQLIVSRVDGRDALALEIAGPRPAEPERLKSAIENTLRLGIVMRFINSIEPGGPRLVDLRSGAMAG